MSEKLVIIFLRKDNEVDRRIDGDRPTVVVGVSI